MKKGDFTTRGSRYFKVNLWCFKKRYVCLVCRSTIWSTQFNKFTKVNTVKAMAIDTKKSMVCFTIHQRNIFFVPPKLFFGAVFFPCKLNAKTWCFGWWSPCWIQKTHSTSGHETVMFVGVPSKGPSQCEPKDPWQIPRNRFCPRRLQDRWAMKKDLIV